MAPLAPLLPPPMIWAIIVYTAESSSHNEYSFHLTKLSKIYPIALITKTKPWCWHVVVQYQQYYIASVTSTML